MEIKPHHTKNQMSISEKLLFPLLQFQMQNEGLHSRHSSTVSKCLEVNSYLLSKNQIWKLE